MYDIKAFYFQSLKWCLWNLIDITDKFDGTQLHNFIVSN